jgi:hypothetical protein
MPPKKKGKTNICCTSLMLYTCWEAETGGSRVPGQSRSHSEIPVSKINKINRKGIVVSSQLLKRQK